MVAATSLTSRTSYRNPSSAKAECSLYVIRSSLHTAPHYRLIMHQAMYQREALWIALLTAPPNRAAVKVSVGGVNALTGEPQGAASKSGEQDYLPVNSVNGQMYVSVCLLMRRSCTEDQLRQLVGKDPLQCGKNVTQSGRMGFALLLVLSGVSFCVLLPQILSSSHA